MSDVIYWDEDMPSFGLRCLRPGAGKDGKEKAGTRRYIVQYRTTDGTQRRVRLGDPKVVSLEDAKDKARDLLAQVQLGGDPQRDRKDARHAPRVSELVDDYLKAAEKRLRERSYAETGRHLRQHAKPLHSRPANAVDRREIAELLASVAEHSGGVTANRVRSSLSAMWTWAVMEGRQEQNPVAATRKPTAEASRERVLTDWELAAIWKATGGDHDHDRIVRVLMLTAARRDEVGRMEWSELDGDLWTVPGKRTKNGLPHELPLPALAVAQLPKRQGDCVAVFGKKETGFSGWSRCKARLDGRLLAQLVKAFKQDHGRAPRKDEVKLATWTLHDLRRTVATWLNEHGELPHVVEAVLNHVSGAAKRGVAGTYNRALYREQKRTALAHWAKHVAELAGQNTANVATLRRG
ncbi:MAG TPA: site-specific integrase [Acetobacteraceae bacterium]|nr:site-specific integrase [Acetobacteraceae bacterium]